MLSDTTIIRNKDHCIPFRVWLRVRRIASRFSRPKLNSIIEQKLAGKNFTIFSNNCLGGVFYHDAGRQFTSPTINLAFDGEDFIKFLEAPEKYYKKNFSFFTWEGHNYPLAKVEDIEVRFVHYKTEEECIQKWNTRFERIDWDHIFVVATDVDGMYQPQWLERFDKLPYKNKIMFTAKKYPQYAWAVPVPAFRKKNNVHILTDFANLKGQRYYETCVDLASWISENC